MPKPLSEPAITQLLEIPTRLNRASFKPQIPVLTGWLPGRARSNKATLAFARSSTAVGAPIRSVESLQVVLLHTREQLPVRIQLRMNFDPDCELPIRDIDSRLVETWVVEKALESACLSLVFEFFAEWGLICGNIMPATKMWES